MSRHITQAGWDDVPHLKEKDKKDLLASLPHHQRDARTKGVPSIGAGAIYPIAEEDIKCNPFEIPDYFRRAYGLDVGWNKTAAIWGAYDPDDDILYLCSEYYRGHAEPAIHASAIKSRGSWINGVIDYAGTNQSDGKRIMHLYQDDGLKVHPANKAVEAGLLEVYQRLSTGRIKVFKTLANFFSEYRIYRRDDKGRVVKSNDHLMDAARYLVMGMSHMDIKPVRNTVSGGFRAADTTAGY